MSNDQLSWDKLFATNEGGSQEKTEKSGSAERSEKSDLPAVTVGGEGDAEKSSVANPSSEKSVLKRGTRKTSSEKSTRDAGSKTGLEASIELSKKNWGKLEMSSSGAAAEATENSSVTASTSHELSRSTKTATRAAEAPTLAVMSEPQTAVSTAAASPSTSALVPDKTPHVYSISDINRGIRETLEGKYSILWLKGEISNFKAHTSGHFYFSLKDSKAQISAVMFRGFNTGLRFRPEDGMEVLVRGKVTVYEPRGNYQIFCETMEPVGAGALQKAFEQLKAKLQGEGLFDESRKRPLPALPKHIAIVTSPTGAAIRDMLNVLGRRFRGAQITVIPCKVQGDQAPGEIIRAIALANQLQDVDVMICGRGGGSIEDLWAFNDERVARAIAAARVPTISAVGHEIDFTIADFVADLRAPTPSAAAELVVRNAAELSSQIAGLDRSLRLSMMRFLNQSKQNVSLLGRRLVDPQRRILDASQRCDELVMRLTTAVRNGLRAREMRVALLTKHLGSPLGEIRVMSERVKSLRQRLNSGADQRVRGKHERVSRLMAVLDSLSPLRVLDRGFSMVTRAGRVMTDATELKQGDEILVRMGRGEVAAEVKSIQSR